MALLEDIEAEIMALANERDAAIQEYKEKLTALKQKREAELAQQKIAALTDVEKDALRTALNQPADQVINANGVDATTQVGEIGAA